ncbi:hypothetical protein GCM10027360_66800 [Amycolatopsis echigonensis]
MHCRRPRTTDAHAGLIPDDKVIAVRELEADRERVTVIGADACRPVRKALTSSPASREADCPRTGLPALMTP